MGQRVHVLAGQLGPRVSETVRLTGGAHVPGAVQKEKEKGKALAGLKFFWAPPPLGPISARLLLLSFLFLHGQSWASAALAAHSLLFFSSSFSSTADGLGPQAGFFSSH